MPQTHPDYVYTRPSESLVKANTNPLYKFFRQNYFTAGDYKQFLEFWDATPSPPLTERPVHPGSLNLAEGLSMPNLQIEWPKYNHACVHDVFQTFMYITEKFKKGLFLRTEVDRPSLKVFLPFSKVNFTNEWFSFIQLNKKRFSSVQDMMRCIAEMEEKPYVESRVHKDIKSWYGNNGLVRLEFPTSEGDSGCNMLKDMFETLAREKKIPNASFFVNKRDFPLLHREGRESYTSFFGDTPLVSHHYDRYAFILGMTTTASHADIPIPTWEDWCRVSYWHDQRMFGKEFRTYPTPGELNAIPWEQRQPTAVFRGASTGLGTTVDNNPRLFFAAESAKKKKDVDGVLFLDAGITKWNLRPRKHPHSKYLETISVTEMPFSLVDPMSPEEQAQYKYLLHLPGHSCAYRLSLELFSGSVILFYPSEYKLWFSDSLRPWEHYVPLDPSRPSDIYEKIKWCKANDVECQRIAANALQFAETYLTREGILHYLETLLWDLVNRYGEIRYAPKTLYDCVEKKVGRWVDRWESAQKKMVMDPLVHHLFQDFSLEDKVFSPRLLSYYVSYRRTKDPRFLEKEERTLLTTTKNTRVEKVSLLSSPLIIKTCQKKEKHNQYPSFYASVIGLNELSEKLPHFMYTYSIEERANEWVTVHEHVQGVTLENYIRESKPSFQELVNLWLMICLALHAAQQTMGFLHMDLYPWNVMICRNSKAQSIVYPIDTRHSLRLITSIVPVLIDYEKSHFVQEGLHVYNTSPFRFCRLQDVLSLVFSSLSIYLEVTHSTSEQEMFRILHCMNFFCSPYTQNHRFHSLSHVKIFLKKHKKFSRMMYEPKTGLETKSPLDFFRHMVNSQFPHTILSHPPRMDFLRTPSSLHIVKAELELLQKVYVEAPRVSPAEKKITLRRYWLSTEKALSSFADPWDKISTWYGLYVRKLTLSLMQKRFKDMEERLGGKIWEHHGWEDLMGHASALPKEEIFAEWQKWMTVSHSSANQSPEPPPFLASHVCTACIEKTTVSPKTYTMTSVARLLFILSQILPDRIPNVDWFCMWTQDFNYQMNMFLKKSLLG